MGSNTNNKQGGPQGLLNDVDARKQHAVDAAMANVRTRLAAKTRQYDDLLDAFETYKAANDFLAQVDTAWTEPEPLLPIDKSGKSESMLVGLAADWHVFETVRPAEVSGLNEYTPGIASASAKEFFRGFVKWLQIHRGGTIVNTGVLAFLGDLMSGHLWPDQVESNAGSPLEEALFVADAVISGIDYVLAESYLKEIVICAIDGNHSRITGKERRVTNRVKHSLEWLLFQFVRRHYDLKGEKRIRWHISDGIHLYLPIDYAGGKTLRFTHGDEGLNYQGGVGGLAVPAQRAIKQWDIARKADLTIFGHWHTTEHPRAYVAVGSALGYSPLSLRYRTEYEPPMQALLLFEKTRWETAYHKLYLR